MKITFWGVRGSIPSPLRPQLIKEKICDAIINLPDIDTKNPQAVQNYVNSLPHLLAGTAGGNTTCVHLQLGNETVIIDAGSGIRELGLQLMKGPCGRGEGVIHFLFTHPHWDHIQGFPFFVPAFIPGNRLIIHCFHDMKRALTAQQESLFFPVPLIYMQAKREFDILKVGQPFNIGDVQINTIKNQHPGDAYSYRFDNGHSIFVFASDSEYKHLAESTLRPYLDFFEGADVLVFDAQYTQREAWEKIDWGHSSSLIGADMARRARVKKLVLFHHDPTYTDYDLMQIQANTIKYQETQGPSPQVCQVLVAYEGMTFDLTQPGDVELDIMPDSRAAILTPTSIFDERGIPDLEAQLKKLEEHGWPPLLIVNLDQVKTLTMAGLRALISLRHEREGTDLLLAGPSDSIQKIITLAGFANFFTIYPSVQTALSTMQSRTNLIGRTIEGRYQIKEKISLGRLGMVYKARDIHTEDMVAFKEFSPAFSAEAIDKFLSQARKLKSLNHPHVVKVFDCGSTDTLAYIAEEYVESTNLHKVLTEREQTPLPIEQSLDIAVKMAKALEYAHREGVVHGDLTTRNVLIGESVKVTDFGQFRLEEGQSLLEKPLIFLTARYVAPEQIKGKSIDNRTDLYSFGAILYEIFSGHPIFSGSDVEILQAHLTQIPQSPSTFNPAITSPLEHIILKLLAKSPEDRYHSIEQVRHNLSSLLMGGSTKKKFLISSPQQQKTLIGRNVALKTVLKHWDLAQQGRGQLVFITGETGIGKTRFLQEIITHTEADAVLMGRCYPVGMNPPYQLFIDIIQTYFSTVTLEHHETEVSQLLDRMAAFVPEIHNILPNLSEVRHSTSTNENQINPLADMPSLSQYLKQAIQNQVWLFILDDLQWADQSSLQLLQYLAEQCHNLPLLIVASYTNTNLENATDKTKPFMTFLRHLHEHIQHELVSLAPLNLVEVKQMLLTMWATETPMPLVEALHNHANGNPLYVEAIAKNLIAEKYVTLKEEGKWHFDAVDKIRFPRSVQEAIFQRIYNFDNTMQDLLYQAAVMGNMFKVEDLKTVCQCVKEGVFETLDMALEEQLIEKAHNGIFLQFGHTEVRDILYDDLSRMHRQNLHKHVGETLETCYHHDHKSVVEQLAHHFQESDEIEKAFTYSVQSAQRAESVYASISALTWYSQAVDIFHRLDLPPSEREQLFDLLLAREEIYSRLGSRDQQTVDLATLSILAQRMQAPSKQGIAHNRYARYYRLVNNYSLAQTHADLASELGNRIHNPTIEGESLIHLSYIARASGNIQEARQYLDTAYAMLKKTDDKENQARVHVGLGLLYALLNNYEQAKLYLQQALLLYRSIGNRSGEVQCLSCFGQIAYELGNYVEANNYYQLVLTMSRIINERLAEAITLDNLSLNALALGNYKQAKTYIEMALPMYHEIDYQIGVAKVQQTLGAIYYEVGAYQMSYENIMEALTIFKNLSDQLHHAETQIILALALEGLENTSAADDAYSESLILYRSIGNVAGMIDAQAGLARCYMAQKNKSDALHQIELCLAWLDKNDIAGVKYPIHFYLTAHEVLLANNMPDIAKNMLKDGYIFLQKRSAQISNEHLRETFLGVIHNAELLAMYHEKQTD